MQTNKTTENKLLWVELLRIAASLAVIATHVTAPFYNYSYTWTWIE